MKFVAERKLLFSQKGATKKNALTVKVSAPIVATDSNAQFPVDGVVAVCRVEIEGLDEPGFDLYGVDSLQAINLASNIEPLLKRLSQKYDFFWATGEPYFET